jgi:hypothetical protein
MRHLNYSHLHDLLIHIYKNRLLYFPVQEATLCYLAIHPPLMIASLSHSERLSISFLPTVLYQEATIALLNFIALLRISKIFRVGRQSIGFLKHFIFLLQSRQLLS